MSFYGTRGSEGGVRRGFGNRGRSFGMRAGLPARGPLGVNTRQSSYTIAKSFNRAKDVMWQHDLFNDSLAASGIEAGTKLYISNLDYRVSNDDIKELFSEIGVLKRFAVHYDGNGRPNGSAEVVFSRRSDAMAAMKRYNNVLLDGRAMKIEVIGADLGIAATPRVSVVAASRGRGRRTISLPQHFGGRSNGGSSFQRTPVMNSWAPRVGKGRGSVRVGIGGRGQGLGRFRGRGRGRGRKPQVVKTADQLDKELDQYHADAMQS